MIIEIIHSLKEKNISKIIRCIKSCFPPLFIGNLVFYKNYGRWINKKNPVYLDEKLLILRGSVYYKNKLITKCVDKYEVRKYVEKVVGEGILNQIYGVFLNANEINWDIFPVSFVVKCNHGSGYNIIVKDKNKFNYSDAIKKLNYWMKEDFGIISSELQYKNIPRKIIVEKYIPSVDSSVPIDYKFFCSKGNVICCLVVLGRDKEEKRIYVDKDFNDLKFVDEYRGTDYKRFKPKSYSQMIDVASSLSKDFPFVRVDLYDLQGSILFGELTFTPHGCIHKYLPIEAQKWIGSFIQL